MSASAHLRTTEALLAFRSTLLGYTADATAALREAELELRRLLERLSDLVRQTLQRIERFGALVDELESALAWCDEDDGCDRIAAELAHTRRELNEAECYLDTLQRHQRVIEERGLAFLREQRRFIDLTETSVPQGAEFLVRLRNHIERYGQVAGGDAMPAADLTAISGSGPSGDADSEALIDRLLPQLHEQAASLLDAPNPSAGASYFRDYRFYQYASLNAYMRTGSRGTGLYGRTDAEVHKIIGSMSAEFGRFHLAQATPLFRGVRRSSDMDQMFGGVAPGEILRDAAFVSTSLQESTAREFAQGGYLFRITAPVATTYVPLTTRPGSGDHFQEAELVLPPGTRFVVTGRQLETALGPDRVDTVIDVVALPPTGLRPTYTSDIVAFAEAAWKEYARELGRR